jgi:hypothetical protein
MVAGSDRDASQVYQIGCRSKLKKARRQIRRREKAAAETAPGAAPEKILRYALEPHNGRAVANRTDRVLPRSSFANEVLRLEWGDESVGFFLLGALPSSRGCVGTARGIDPPFSASVRATV